MKNLETLLASDYMAPLESINEFKTGYKIDDVDSLIFQPELLDNVEELIRPCADDKKVGTVYKILSKEIIPHYLLNKKPNKIFSRIYS